MKPLRSLRRGRSVVAAWFLVCLMSLTVGAQSQPNLGSGELVGAQVIIEVDGVLYNENGELIVSALLTNVGDEVMPPIDVIVVLLNDCILTNVPQTCRFAAFGNFHGIAANGIAPGSAVRWTFNFGPYPRLDLDRWSVIWYPMASSLTQSE